MVPRIVLVGPPGVGKGTLASLLEMRTGAKPLSTGQIFRAEIDADTDLGQLAKSYIDHGHLVPNGVTIQMVVKRLRSDEVRHRGFILDGFPRTLRQAEALTEEMEHQDCTLTAVLSLEVPVDVIIDRLAGRLGCTRCGEIYHATNKPPKREGLCDKCDNVLVVRADDNPDVIRERLESFYRHTQPVVDYYEGRGELRRIDSGRDSSVVLHDVLGMVGA